MINHAIFSKDVITSKTIVRVFGVLTFVLLTALGAYIRVPLGFTPVPLTMQTFFVILSGAVLGRYLGALAQFIYILLGVSGFSLFTNSGSGVFYLFGPTAGYLFGFLIASFMSGRLLAEKSGFLKSFGIFFISALAILFCGAVWLGVFLKLGFYKAFILGVLPFLAGDCLKAYAAALVYAKISRRVKEIF